MIANPNSAATQENSMLSFLRSTTSQTATAHLSAPHMLGQKQRDLHASNGWWYRGSIPSTTASRGCWEASDSVGVVGEKVSTTSDGCRLPGEGMEGPVASARETEGQIGVVRTATFRRLHFVSLREDWVGGGVIFHHNDSV